MKKLLFPILLVTLGCFASKKDEVLSIVKPLRDSSTVLGRTTETRVCEREYGDTCVHDNLSEDFNIATSWYSDTKLDEFETDYHIFVDVANKQGGKKQSFHLQANSLHSSYYEDCERVRSYSTKLNDKVEPDDIIDFGTVVVADFNFDEVDDFAVISYAHSTGPDYTFFIQHDGFQFIQDTFLTNQGCFPSKFKKESKELITLFPTNPTKLFERTFRYEPKHKKWTLINSLETNQ